MKRDAAPLPVEEGEAQKTGRPPHGADDGKTDGASQGGKRSAGNFAGDATHGHNVQSGMRRGTETERDAPGISSEKKGDDAK